MPPKSFRLKEKEYAEKLYYRWEFIRRNKAYQEDQAKFVSRFSKWFKRRGLELQNITGYNQELFERYGFYRKRTSRYFMQNVEPFVEAFFWKWSVSWPCSPSFRFKPDDIDIFHGTKIGYYTRYKNSPVRHCNNSLRLDASIEKIAEEMNDFCNPKPLKKKNHFGETSTTFKVADEKGTVRCAFIKFPEPRNPENSQIYNAAIWKIIEEMYSSETNLEKIAGHFLGASISFKVVEEKKDNRFLFSVRPELGKERNYELFHRFIKNIEWPKKPDFHKSEAKRIQLKKYRGYLRVWDLKNAEPTLTWTEVSRRLYRSKFKQYSSGTLIGEKNAAIQLVIDQYRSAQRLIAGEFQEIR